MGPHITLGASPWSLYIKTLICIYLQLEELELEGDNKNQEITRWHYKDARLQENDMED